MRRPEEPEEARAGQRGHAADGLEQRGAREPNFAGFLASGFEPARGGRDAGRGGGGLRLIPVVRAPLWPSKWCYYVKKSLGAPPPPL